MDLLLLLLSLTAAPPAAVWVCLQSGVWELIAVGPSIIRSDLVFISIPATVLCKVCFQDLCVSSGRGVVVSYMFLYISVTLFFSLN